VTSIVLLGRLPQVTLPLGDASGVPIGLSLLAGYGQDAFFLGVAAQVAEAAT
jgi:amidase